MSGIPRPVGPDELPNGSVSVRLIRGSLANNIANHPVELRIGDKVQTVQTDSDGRAQFDRLPAGATLQAVAIVDGERLESQFFPTPAQGGIRLMLVATDKDGAARASADANTPVTTAPVAFGGESRIVIEPGDESVSVYFMFEIVNNTANRINPPEPIQFDMPTGALGTTILQGSSPLASHTGDHVRVLGPFPPGTTSFEVAASLPVTSGSMDVELRFPVNMEQLVVVARKEGALQVASPQLARVQDTTTEGTPVIIGVGNAVAAGQPIVLTLSGLAHHRQWPRQVALSLAAIIIVGGVIMLARPQKDSEAKDLKARREKLMQELVRLERDRRKDKIDGTKYQDRREGILRSLEAIYRTIDHDDQPSSPALGAS
jgi:hypothetical protein